MTKSCSLSSDLSALWIYSPAASKDSDHGECPTTAGTCAHNALVTWHPASERSSLLSPSNSAGWKKMPAALFWLSTLINKLRLLPREAHSPGKFRLTKNIRLKGEWQAKSLLKDISTGHCYHYWQIQRPQHQPGSALSPAALQLFIPAEYQAFYIYTRYRSISEYRLL